MKPLVAKKWLLDCFVWAATLVGLWFIFRSIQPEGAVAVWPMPRAGWVGLALLANGAALLFAAYRRHIALRTTGTTIHLSASCRFGLIGHFFSVARFGTAAGDSARSAVYARWYHLPLANVLAAVVIDRALALGSVLLVLGVLLGLGGVAGGLEHLGELQWNRPGSWALAAILSAAVLISALSRRRAWGARVWRRAWVVLRAGGGRLLRTPGEAAPGLALALLAQVCLNGVFALNLGAVAPGPLPWAQLAWTFPFITALSGLPFTVAGAGVREVAAIILLGLYGVPGPACVVASLLTLAHHGLWAGAGGALLWREQRLRARRMGRPLPRTISVVIPALNEEAIVAETIHRARAVPEVSEIILVDGGSRDGTAEAAAQLGCRVLRTAASRGGQMRLGAREATADIVLLLHADTWLRPGAGRAALDCLRDATVVAGGFWKTFRQPPWLARGSRWRCGLRVLLGRRILGDQALFVRREALAAIGGVPDMALMEDVELCRRLREIGRLALACATVSTSPRRFEKLGVLRTYFRMWRVATLYRLGARPQKLLEIYERE